MKLETKVGAFFIGSVVLAGTLVLRLEKINIFSKRNSSDEYVTEFKQTAGLNLNNPVRIAGVRVGEVRRIVLKGNVAQVTFVLEEGLQVYADAIASLSSIGILGEKYIDLNAGNPNSGLLGPTRFVRGTDAVSLDNLIKTVETIAVDVKGVTSSLNQTFGGDAGRAKLAEIFENVRALSAELRAISQENRGSIRATMANVEAISNDLRNRLPAMARQFEDLGKNLNALVDENRPEVKGITTEVRKLAQGFQGTSENIKSITNRLNAGEGTLGKLLTDDATVKKINTAVDNVNELMTGIKGMDLRLDMGAARWDKRGDSLSGINLELAPRKDYWYAVGLNSTPDGKVADSQRKVTKIDPVTGLPKEVLENTRTVTYDQTFTVSAQFAKRLGDHLVVSAGIIDGKGGGAAEYRSLDDRFRASLMAYDFTRRDGKDKPRVRLTTSWQFFRGLYLQAGVQDAANKELRTLFYGGGIRWKDEDLKKLVGLAGAAK